MDLSKGGSGASGRLKLTHSATECSQNTGLTYQGGETFALFNPTRSGTLDEEGQPLEYWKEDEVVDALHSPTGNKEPLVVWAIEAVGRKMSGGPEVGMGVRKDLMFTLDRDSKHAVALISSAEDFPVKISALQEEEPGSQESSRASSGRSSGSPKRRSQSGDSSRMFQGSFLPMVDETSGLSSRGYGKAGVLSDTGFSTLSISESPRDAVGSSLSAVLQKRVSERYFLSPKAAKRILRRAERRGRTLPTALQQALEALATGTTKGGTQTT